MNENAEALFKCSIHFTSFSNVAYGGIWEAGFFV